MQIGQNFVEVLRGLRATLERRRSISFSQYSEDTLLYNFGPQRSGFYIDVGAFHPWNGSNTYKLYLRGWSGITIEPNPGVAELFRSTRPRDLHLTMGIAGIESQIEYYEFDDPHLNSFDPQQAERMGVSSKHTTKIACTTLRDVVDRSCSGKKIDLLSVDCEGLDYEALKSLSLDHVRPRVIVVEDFEQFMLTEAKNFSRIQEYLNGSGYVLCSQAIFSFIYVDKAALTSIDETGFCIGRSQLRALAGPYK